MTDSPRVPAALLQAVERDLRPVKPLGSPTRRAIALLPFGLLMVVGVPVFWGWRENLAGLGLAESWGLSALQALVGLLVIGLAFREAVPGRELPVAALGSALLAVVALFLGITWLTSQAAPTVVPAGVWIRFLWECYGMAALSSLPVLLAAAWLSARALPTRPALAGALYGAGAGFMADSGVRLFCWVSTPAHVIVAHGGAIVSVAAIGALMAVAVDRLKGRC